jgi:hypothetical protein
MILCAESQNRFNKLEIELRQHYENVYLSSD